MYILEILKQGFYILLLLSAPPMLIAIFVGVTISLIQSMMQLQDATLPFVLKLISVGIMLFITGRWILDQIVQLSLNCFDLISQANY
ncbi:type III secretion system export apparatus subunit SctS [Erwinia psidii]|uniref:Flagellar biosynthetic protein FliQ n=1 Tax=Erwinia psidii TaxID=69224 RepID=A0A3N6SPZ6_9GAMM|nr:type III secretion system export apparatus subunit SctS [Erwinia psidii]MCX8956571.1 flagellar biosynthetic protein FliQ [Erwinia psidii]MCX8961519.1 flagellar biosynthetic protein FliQ [Erwinia psidii]MCX8965013.1 flagellar biosynthetic protein FliQ [Erwinia psidii]RQM39906.1 flagellar biosynthetic protein FliQ [Erwinia psidii]